MSNYFIFRINKVIVSARFMQPSSNMSFFVPNLPQSMLTQFGKSLQSSLTTEVSNIESELMEADTLRNFINKNVRILQKINFLKSISTSCRLGMCLRIHCR